ncbi:hypothetical protein JOQ06_028364, partial [Pogonophryne albipinna]
KIAPYPAFVLDGVSRFDIGQGLVENCWFLASIGALTFQNDILCKVVPLEQTFNGKYCGMFHFRFWRFGRWVDVIIDDKLPTIDGRLIFVHSKDQNEFWPALLEKAYAKVCGSYTDMNAGTPAEAMMDFTGGVHMSIALSNPPTNLWELICRASQTKSLMGCGTARGETSANAVLPNGLVQGHAYTVTGVQQMMSRGKQINLVRLWNPWGTGEWNRDWSDRSPLWQTVSSKDREMCLSVADDGEFWMSLEDLCEFYTDLDICSLSPDYLDGNSSCHWKTYMNDGRWVAGTTAGGCMNNRNSYWTNPQYRVNIGGQSPENNGEKNVLVSLMQKPDKRNRHLVQSLHIGLCVFEVKDKCKAQKGKFPASFFSSHTPVAQSKTYINAREVMEFLMLRPGEQRPWSMRTLVTLKMSQLKGSTSNKSQMNRTTRIRYPFSDKTPTSTKRLLNENVLKGDLKSGGFTIDACRSMVALMDTSITGKLNGEEFVRLWKKVLMYKDIFFRTDVSRTGTLSMNELRNAFLALGIKVKDDMLSLMALRYGASTGHLTLESFISLILRFGCMYKIFKQLSGGQAIILQESEWMYISMYT